MANAKWAMTAAGVYEAEIGGQRARITEREFGWVVEVNDELIVSRKTFDRAKNSASWYSKNMWDRPLHTIQTAVAINEETEAEKIVREEAEYVAWYEAELLKEKKEAAAAKRKATIAAKASK